MADGRAVILFALLPLFTYRAEPGGYSGATTTILPTTPLLRAPNKQDAPAHRAVPQRSRVVQGKRGKQREPEGTADRPKAQVRRPPRAVVLEAGTGIEPVYEVLQTSA
jgi:hypothetical protein